ncbi:hypothetical protein [Delftia sp. PS-11]|uniref:hypothetical protein n=1 Tax=Delftia sp. PS-11 TaxID=2767222 RepID=UPI002454F792|nr:hypothetical protein [Delftia sp. PS-11]KAJ8745857.1 hypothetical protein H9T68_04150 [Delftia sp. PS-11]
MDFFTLAIIVFIAIYLLKTQQQRRHTLLLAQYLGRFQIEKLMGGLIEGYMRALGEADAQRRAQVWTVLDNTETSLSEQLQRFAREFAAAEPEMTRVSTLPLALPYLDRLFPQSGFDMREAMQLHARAIAAVRVSESASDDERRDRAFTMTAELLLMQYTCHWYCKSRAVASVRLVARHKTPYEQVLASVAPQTRQAYLQMIS